jgi:hypothetical protein
MVRTLGIVIVNPLIGAAADRSLQHTVIGLGVGLVLVSLVSRVEERFLLD